LVEKERQTQLGRILPQLNFATFKNNTLAKTLARPNPCILKKNDLLQKRDLKNKLIKTCQNFDQRKKDDQDSSDYLAFQLAMVMPIIAKIIRPDSPNSETEIF